MSKRNIHVGDIGTQLIATVYDCQGNTTVVLDISTATVTDMLFIRPGESSVYRTASFLTDGTDGKIVWTSTTAADFVPAGQWRVRAKITMPGWSGHSSDYPFEVHAIT